MATFKTRARALDMLGRQQIAGIPTAISELFKNAHDAYADNVVVDYFRSDGLFVLRDDGLGMTQDDFIKRWLVLGTESKVGAGAGISQPPIDPSKAARPILGEKGIGRLAIGIIGPQVLVLTRAKREEKLHELVAAFIHWGLFALPGIDLDQVEVPLRTFRGGTVPTGEDVQSLVEIVKENVNSLHKNAFIASGKARELLTSLDRFKLDPNGLNQYLRQPHLLENGHGTQFYILPADQSLAIDIDNQSDSVASPLIRTLIGFTNTMTPDHNAPRITASFNDHKTEDLSEDLISELEFFTPDEFQSADHHFRGQFDEYGQFRGYVSIYGEEPVEHVVAWPEARGIHTECGPFEINVAYVQGAQRESRVEATEHARLIQKLHRLGGLYIYKDDIRILPYGNSDYDFINIEKRRTLGAAYYYFSYRRMVGAIEISQEKNDSLKEKAGREGFQENKAYRQFRAILENFFIQLASDFFREGGPQSDEFHRRREELHRLTVALKKKESQNKPKLRTLRLMLEEFFSHIEKQLPQQQIAGLLQHTERDLSAALQLSDEDAAVSRFVDIESKARQSLQSIRDTYKVVKPRGVGLSKPLLREWEAYTVEAGKLDAQVFEPALHSLEQIIAEKAREANVSIDRRRRIERITHDQAENAIKAAQTKRREVAEEAERLRTAVIDVSRKAIANVRETTEQAEANLARLNTSSMTEAELSAAQKEIETRITTAFEHSVRTLDVVREQISSLDFSFDEQGRLNDSADTTEALEQEVLALREQTEADLELSQLGMAVQIVNHELTNSTKTVRRNLQRLKSWGERNKGLQEIYQNLRISFEHLDGYLTLFTPLQRRLYRKPVEITGAGIHKFLSDVFTERLNRHQITLEPTSAFRRKSIEGYPSVFYPVFVNLLDNAIFWLRDRPLPRQVILDADDNGFIVHDNGSGIAPRDRVAIFDAGFTRKPGGRGLGLHISREILRKSGYDLEIADTAGLSGAKFIVRQAVDGMNLRIGESG